ncbi:MAG: CAP domain-containing protein [Ruminococcus sp.]|nr:CAP domain-containing protein [Ruminococcus sp.]
MPIKVTCKNILNPNTFVGNCYVNPSTGALKNDTRANSFKTYIVPVDCHKSYTISGVFSHVVYAFYSKNTINAQNIIGQPHEVSYMDNTHESRVSFVLQPSENTDAKYLVFSLMYVFCKPDNPDYQIEEGTSATPYVPPDTTYDIARIIKTDSSGQTTEIEKIYSNNTVVWKKKSYTPELLEKMAEQVAYLINQERKAIGVGQLYLVPYLNECATIRAEEISVVYNHQRPDGTVNYSVIDTDRLFWLQHGELIAESCNTPLKAVKSWKDNSTTDARWKTAMRDSFTHVGVGVFYDKNADKLYWAVIQTCDVDPGASYPGQYLPTNQGEDL